MAAPIATRRLTKDDVLALPESDCYELVDGQLVERAVSWESSWLGARTARFIGVFAEPAIGFVSGSDNRLELWDDRPYHFRRPDVSFTRKERVPGGRPGHGDQLIAPDLAVEVVSPGDTVYGLNAKISEYLAAGVRLVWVIHPDTRTADVHRLDGRVVYLDAGQALDGEDVLPGFRLPLSELFAGMPTAE